MAMSAFTVAVVERDKSDDVLCVWSFPGLSSALQPVLEARCLKEGQACSAMYFKVRSEWVYVLTLPARSEVQPFVQLISMCIVTKAFNPEKFTSVLQIFYEQYVGSADPTKILEAYLSINATGCFTNRIGTFDNNQYLDAEAFAVESALLELAKMLGVDIIILWNAVLLKKRILVVGDCISQLLTVVRTLPQLAWHRQDWSICRPLIGAEPEHMEDICSAGVFIAGSLDGSLANNSDLFDVILSLTEGRVTITQHAVGGMKMCSIHRDVLAAVQECVDRDLAAVDIIRVVEKKTSQVIANLRGLASGEALTELAIVDGVQNAGAQQWLVRLATAENLI